MRRAVGEIIDPGPRNIDPLWDHFESRCAYCERELVRDLREGHVDHAESGGGNHLGNMVLACGSCNGDEKRDESWRDFLERKATTHAVFALREQRILAWFERHPPSSTEPTHEVARARDEIEELIQEFALKCGELKKLVSERSGAAR